MPNIGQNVDEVEFLHVVDGMENGTTIFWKDVATSYKVKHATILWLTNCISKYFPKRN